jgi:hypothetical protein
MWALIGPFEGSSGSSILNVFGSKIHASHFSSSVNFTSLEWLRRVGEPLSEQQLLVAEEDGDRQLLHPVIDILSLCTIFSK